MSTLDPALFAVEMKIAEFVMGPDISRSKSKNPALKRSLSCVAIML